MLLIITGFILISLIFASLGCLVLWKNYISFSDGLSHASILAGSLSIIIDIDISYAGILVGIIFTFIILKFKHKAGSNEIINLTSSALLSAAFLLSNVLPSSIKIDQLLFGDILSINIHDIKVLIGLLTANVIFVGRYNKDITRIVLSRDIAIIKGVKVERLEFIFLSLLSISIFISIKIVGALLVTAIILIPAMIARILAKSPVMMILYAVVIAIIMSTASITLAYNLDIAIAPIFVIIGFISYLISSKTKG